MKIGIEDVKLIVNKVTNGGGGTAITLHLKSSSQRWL